MPLEDIVDLTISADTVTVARTSFGIPLILAYHTRFAERWRKYTSTAAMITDGFVSTDPAYKMAQKIFAQNPKCKSVIVGRCANAQTQTIDLTPIAAHLTVYAGTIDGIAWTFTSDANATVAEICTGVAAAINAAMPATTVLATDNTTKVTLSSEAAGRSFELALTVRSRWTRDDVTADPGIVADLQAIRLENDEWYTVHPTHQSTLAVVALAAEVETLKKLLITESADDDILAGNGLGATLKAAAYVRTALVYHALPHEFPGAAWAGKVLPYDPGSATWKFKTLAGVTVDAGFSATQRTNMRGDNVNFYEATGGVSIMEEGYSAEGEFIDITQGSDWLASRLQERIFSKFASSKKVPFTDAGIAIVEAEIRGQLQEGINSGFLAADPAFTVVVPLAKDVSAADKTARRLTGVEFSAPLAGAIHSTEITGNLTV